MKMYVFHLFGIKIFKHRLKIGLRKDSFFLHLKEIFSGLVVVEQMLPGPDRRQMSGGAYCLYVGLKPWSDV